MDFIGKWSSKRFSESNLKMWPITNIINRIPSLYNAIPQVGLWFEAFCTNENMNVKLNDLYLQDRVRRVFFGSLNNPLYSVLNIVLQNSSLASDDISEYVTEVGDRRDYCEAMTADSDGNVYFGLIGDGSIARWNTSLPLDKPSEILVHDPKQLVWINSIFIDEGSIWVVSNRSGLLFYAILS